jgi:hypothetical protein
MSWPSDGASIGTRMNTIITIDMTWAICRPTNRSRTMAVTMIRPTDPPIPWRNRAATSCEKLCVVIATVVASTKSERPSNRGRRRPKRSASGPQTSCPIAIPSTNTVTTSGRLLVSGTPSVAPISGSPGSMMSIDIAVIDINSAISAMNSRNGSGKCAAVSSEMRISDEVKRANMQNDRGAGGSLVAAQQSDT